MISSSNNQCWNTWHLYRWRYSIFHWHTTRVFVVCLVLKWIIEYRLRRHARVFISDWSSSISLSDVKICGVKDESAEENLIHRAYLVRDVIKNGCILRHALLAARHHRKLRKNRFHYRFLRISKHLRDSSSSHSPTRRRAEEKVSLSLSLSAKMKNELRSLPSRLPNSDIAVFSLCRVYVRSSFAYFSPFFCSITMTPHRWG